MGPTDHQDQTPPEDVQPVEDAALSDASEQGEIAPVLPADASEQGEPAPVLPTDVEPVGGWIVTLSGERIPRADYREV